MRAWVRLGLAGGVIVAALLAVWMLGTQAILVSDVQAMKRDDGTLRVAMTIRNIGEADRLIAAASDDAEAVLVSTDAEELPIPANSSVSLSADGAFIALKDIRGDVEDGRLVPLRLSFANAGEVVTKARIGQPAMTHGSMMHGAMGDSKTGIAYEVPESEPAPSLSISADPVAEGGWALKLEIENFTFSKEAADGPHQPGIGHAHLYVGGVKLGRLYASSAMIPALPAGEHIIRVTLNTNNHMTYRVGGEAVTATVVVSAP